MAPGPEGVSPQSERRGPGLSPRGGTKREGSVGRQPREEPGSAGERVRMRLWRRKRAGAGRRRAGETSSEMRSLGRTRWDRDPPAGRRERKGKDGAGGGGG